jgi:hypothetical protein
MDSALGHALYAKYDLRVGGDIYDWKTGKAHDLKDIAKSFSEKPANNHEFQPLMYIQTLREKLGPDCPVSFNLVYLGNRCAEMISEGDARDLRRIVRTVAFEDIDDAAAIRKYGGLDAVYEDICDKSTYSKYVNNWDAVCAAVLQLASDPGWIESDSTLVTIVNVLGANVNQSSLKSAKSFVNKFKPYCGDVREVGGKVVVSPAYMDRFVDRLQQDSVEATESLALPMFKPVREKFYCKYCDYVSLCMSPLAADSSSDGEEE